MAAPSTPILDNFNRADENPAVGWTADVSAGGYANFQVLSNQMAPAAGAFSSAYWNATAFGSDQECYLTVPTLGAATYTSILARIQNPGASVSFYEFSWDAGNSYLLKAVAGGARTQLGGSLGVVISAGDKVWLNVTGSTITSYRFTGGAWAVMDVPRTDTAITGAGYVGAWVQNDTAVRLDDFGGGAIIVQSASTPTHTNQSLLLAGMR